MFTDLEKDILYIIINADEAISSGLISKIINVSINTIRKEIDIINVASKDNGFFIGASTSIGYYIVVENEKQYDNFKRNFLLQYQRYHYIHPSENNMSYLLLQYLICSESYISSSKITDFLYCSKSTLFRLLKNVDNILKPFHCKVDNVPKKGFYIEGSEWNKRMCMIFLHKAYRHTNQEDRRIVPDFVRTFDIDGPAQVKCRQILLDFMSLHPNLYIPSMHFPKLYNFIILNKTRYKYENNFGFTNAQISYIKSLPCYSIAKKLYLTVPSEYKYSDMDNSIIAFAILLGCCANISNINEIPTKDYPQISQEVKELIISIVDHFGYINSFDKDFYDSFCCYLFNLKRILMFDFTQDQEIVDFSSKKGLLTNDLCVHFALFYKKKHGILLNSAQLSDAYYIFNTALLRNNINIKKFSAMIMSRQGIQSSKNIAYSFETSSLKDYFYLVDIKEMSDGMQIFNKQYDLLISDIDINTYKPVNIPHAAVRFKERQYDFSDIKAFVSSRMINGAQSIFTPNNLHKSSFNNKEQLFQSIYHSMIMRCSEKEFIADLLTRNQISSFERGNSIVFVSSMAIEFDHPVFEVYINSNTILFDEMYSHIFIFYSYGKGNISNIESIIYLLDIFLKIDIADIYELYKYDYDELIALLKKADTFL